MTHFASRLSGLRPSPIRDILRVASQPGMISFAGGLPDAQSFPRLPPQVLDDLPGTLQYGPSEGDPALRAHIAAQFNRHGASVTPDQVLILSGSQQGIDLVAKMLIDPGTPVAVESPTYLAALQVFDLYGARYEPFGCDLDSVEDAANRSHLLYTVPTFQNPTGHCYSLAQRQQLAQACDAGQAVLFEDDPYRTLSYAPCDRTPVVTLLKSASWVYQSSFSKEFAPGLRLGYLVASPDLYQRLQWLKQAADLHSNRLGERIILSLLQSDNAQQRLQEICERYRQKRDAFQAALLRHFEGIAKWSVPAGGLFFWLTLRKPFACDTRDLLAPAIEQGVAFMPGESFFPAGSQPTPSLRLNFSHADSAAVDQGLATLAALIRQSV